MEVTHKGISDICCYLQLEIDDKNQKKWKEKNRKKEGRKEKKNKTKQWKPWARPCRWWANFAVWDRGGGSVFCDSKTGHAEAGTERSTNDNQTDLEIKFSDFAPEIEKKETHFDVVHAEDTAAIVHILLQVFFQIFEDERQRFLRVDNVVQSDYMEGERRRTGSVQWSSLCDILPWR